MNTKVLLHAHGSPMRIPPIPIRETARNHHPVPHLSADDLACIDDAAVGGANEAAPQPT